jgi:hypothetical protein
LASPLSSEIKLRFRRMDGAPCDVAEWTGLLLELPGPAEDWESWVVTVNGEARLVSLRRLAGIPCCVCDWPESGAGRYRIIMDHPDWGRRTHDFFLPPAKLGDGALEVLVNDLERRLPHALAASLQRGGALAGLDLKPPQDTSPAAEFVRLKDLTVGSNGVPGLMLLLASIARDPHRILIERTIEVAQERARRPHPVLLRQALYRGQRVDDEGLPLRLFDRRVESSFDTYENRLVKLTSDTLRQRLVRLAPLLSSTSRAEALDLVAGIERARRQAKFLDEVSSLEVVPQAVTQLLLRRAEYRRLLDLWRGLWTGFEVRLEAAALETPLQSVPDLYELWASVSALSEIVAALVTAGYRVQRERLVRRRPEGPLVELVKGPEPVAELVGGDGSAVRVSFQRNFNTTGASLHSLSFDQKPDIVVEVARPDLPNQLLILDPKYKIEERTGGLGPKKEDIDKMHAYRDAIVHRHHGRVVSHAAILYPGPTQHFGGGVSALAADPLDPDALSSAIRGLLRTALHPPSRSDLLHQQSVTQ